jgi:hypothetical protein
MVVGGYPPLPESLTAVIHMPNSTKVLRARTPARLYIRDTLLERLAPGLEDMAAAFGDFIQAAHAMVCQRHVPRRRHLAAADQPHIRDGLVGARDTGRS